MCLNFGSKDLQSLGLVLAPAIVLSTCVWPHLDFDFLLSQADMSLKQIYFVVQSAIEMFITAF